MIAALFLLLPAAVLAVAAHRILFHPLRHVPGPWYAAVSDAWLTMHLLCLRRCRAIDDLFHAYGPVVRAGPNTVFFNDPAGLRTVYASADFDKSQFYQSLLTNENDHS